jgi:hypothetical protein
MKGANVTALCILACAAVLANVQSPKILLPTERFHHVTHLVLKDGTSKSGWFVGALHDSLVLQVGPRSERFAHRDLVRVVVEQTPNKSAGGLAGMLLGMYLGSTLIFSAEGQSHLFAESDVSPAAYPLGNVALGVVGGGVGYLVASGGPSELTFDFAESEEENSATWVALTRGHTDVGRRGVLHFAMQESWVSGPLPQLSRAMPYNYPAAASLNLMRKVQLTFENSTLSTTSIGFVLTLHL